jgi:hypothetical protein
MAYEVAEEFKGQKGKGRIVKHLIFTAQIETENPMFPGTMMRSERLYRLNEEVPVEVLDDYNLSRGESLGSFYTDEELAQGVPQAAALETGAAQITEMSSAGAGNFSEMGEAELADYLIQNRPTVDETVRMAGNDPDTAQRLLEAEHIATEDEPRAGVVKGLNAIIESE